MGICLQGEKKSIKKNSQTEIPKTLESNEKKDPIKTIENKTEKKDLTSKLKRRISINAILKQNQNPSELKKLANQRRQSLKYITDYKNNDQMHNKNYLLNRLAKNLIKNTQNSEEYKKKKEEFPEFIIDWKLVRDSNMETYTWKNNGYIKVTKDLIDEVIKMSPEEAKNCNFLYKKRIWLYFYINSQIQNSNIENPLIIIHRNNILEESFNQFMTIKDINLLEELHIHFVDEIANDEGGVYREWYSCLFKEFFNEKNKLFIENPFKSSFNGTLIINLDYDKSKIDYYFFFGMLIVKAIIDNVYMKEHLNLTIIKNLLNKKIELEEMKFYDLTLYKSLKNILETNIETNETLKEINFTYNLTDSNNKIYQIELIPEGNNIYLNENNKNTFIEKVIYYETYYKYKEPMEKIKEGFYSIIKDNIIGQFYTSRELDFEIVGFKIVDLNDWKNNTIYKGIYNENNETIKIFWNYLNKMKQEDLMKFFNFCTGLCNIPINGFGSLKGVGNKIQKFTIEPLIDYDPKSNKFNNDFKLIEARTCFNRILLPQYKSEEEMKKCMDIILQFDSNYFGLE